MPDRITFDEGIAEVQSAGRITLDDALMERDAQATPAGANRGGPLPGQQRVTRPGPDGLPMYMDVPEPKPARDSNFGAALKENIAADPETKRRLVAESVFPDDPNGINRVGFADGEPVYIDESGELRYVSSRGSRFGAATVANAPEAVAATVGSFATGNPISGSAIGAAGGRALKRGVSALMFDEPVTPGSVAKEMATEAAIDLAGGVVAKGITKGADRGKTVDFSPQDMRSAEEIQRQVKQTTDIDIDLAQASGDRKLIGLKQYAARFPGKSADDVQKFDERSQGQFEQATSNVLDRIARAAPSEVYGRNGMNAAKSAIRQAKNEIEAEVSPLYAAAYAAVPEVNQAMPGGNEVLRFLNLPYFKEAFSAGQKLRSLETGAAHPKQRTVETLTRRTDEATERASTIVDSTPTGARRITSRLSTEDVPRETPDGTLTRRTETVHSDITRPSLAELDYTKRALDEQIESLIESGKGQRARALKIKRDQFVEALDALPNQQWQQARQTYGRLAQQHLRPLEDGVVGIIAKVKDPKAATAAAKIFQDANVTPDQIRYARNVIEKQDPEAWNGMVRQWLGQKWNASLKETQTGDVVNPAGKFRQSVFGTPQDRAKAAAMLPGGAAPVFHDLMTAAEKLASTPIAGSNTMRDTEIKDQLKGTGAVVFQWLTSPRKQVVDAAEQRALEQGTQQITEALLNPAKRSQLKRVVKMAPSTRQAILISSIIGGKATSVAAESVDDRTPPSLDRSAQ